MDKIILGNAPFIAEPYFGHRTRLYDLDLRRNPENVAEIIIESYNQGIKFINLVNDENLLKAYDIALDEGCKMDVVATIGKSFDIDYRFPDFDKASNVNWQKDIDVLTSYNSDLMLIDEFIVDSYKWNLISNILDKIEVSSGLITSFPFKTTDLIPNDLNFDYYMIPINKLGYMMDSGFFSNDTLSLLRDKLLKLDKKIIASKVLATGILKAPEAFDFINSLDFIDSVAIGVASKEEVIEDFNI